MSSFFKRISRSRQNSYVEDYDSPPHHNARSTDKYDARPNSSRQSTSERALDHADAQDMYARQNGPQSPHDAFDPRNPQTANRNGTHINGGPVNGTGMNGHYDAPLQQSPLKSEPAPDLLTQAFNAAVRPYQDKIEQLEAQIAELQGWVETLEQQRADVHGWIDKRGLRPDVPPAIAKQMDNAPDAAATLNAQLDRKITIVNFDLHRLQDDLNDSISSAHFAASMVKFLPDISRLAGLPAGPRFAYDLILKLGGNLNSHGGLDSGDPADVAARKDFYARLDQAMVEVVRGRFREGEDWQVLREVKRLEKTGAYLKNYGVEPYFPGSLEVMRREAGVAQGAAAQQQPAAQDYQMSGARGERASPPRY